MDLLQYWRNCSVCEKRLLLVFLFSLTMVNPWVRGDGVGYYAYARSMITEGRLDFERDWRSANDSFRLGRVDAQGRIAAEQYTLTGRLNNHFAVGPALLWTPFLVATHLAVLALDRLGASISPDGYSRPYRVTMALASALYGFLGLWLSFAVARKYVAERWAFLATLGIWFASSLPVYMYFNPSWSHAHSAFAVALFLWYWERTRKGRKPLQWILLGLVSALMVNVYYPNGILLLIPLVESVVKYGFALRRSPRDWQTVRSLLLNNLAYLIVFFAGLLPTFITREIIFGNPFNLGDYTLMQWHWSSPALLPVLFSAQHGLLSWTPVVVVSLLGLFLLLHVDRALAAYLLLGFFSFYLVIASYPDWHGIASYGNRFFVSLTSIFVIGLAAAFDAVERYWAVRPVAITACAVTAILIVWNLGFIFQWGTHLVPARGPVSWREVASNQVSVVPATLAQDVRLYLFHRRDLMSHIEATDVRRLQEEQGDPPQEQQ